MQCSSESHKNLLHHIYNLEDPQKAEWALNRKCQVTTFLSLLWKKLCFCHLRYWVMISSFPNPVHTHAYDSPLINNWVTVPCCFLFHLCAGFCLHNLCCDPLWLLCLACRNCDISGACGTTVPISHCLFPNPIHLWWPHLSGCCPYLLAHFLLWFLPSNFHRTVIFNWVWKTKK